MRNFRKVAVTAAAVGAAAFGTMAGFGGVASAAPAANNQPGASTQSVTGCSIGGDALLQASLLPSCTTDPSTVVDPTSLEVTVNPGFINALATLTANGGLLGTGATGLLGLGGAPTTATLGLGLTNPAPGEVVSYRLSCVVNGARQDGVKETFTATTDAATQTQDVNLQQAVGSPVPNSCEVRNFTATSTLSLSAAAVTALAKNANAANLATLNTALGTGTVNATLRATTTVPGAIYTRTGFGQQSNICADVPDNDNAGSPVQSYQCNSDLAQFWVYSHNRELVHNGDCMAVDGSNNVVLAKCDGNKDQRWTENQTNGANAKPGTIVNLDSGKCLTDPSTINFTHLTVANCTSAANQRWTAPDRTKSGFGDGNNDD